ncbi:MAG: FAD-binding oxidoreductase, partial [Rhodobacteraceae bacterium]|nr:FAD-binding oxidoreductase [Paracoccaceae bacterium]
AGDQARADQLRADQKMQARLGAGTRMLSPEDIAQAFPFFNLEGIVAGSFNPVDEGYFDGGAIFEWWRRLARERGVEYLHGEVQGVISAAGRIAGVTLANGEKIGCGMLVSAAGPRAAEVAAMAGLGLPVEPRKRFTWVVEAADLLGQDLPLSVDPSGVHIRSDGAYYMIGAAPDPDPAVEPDDLAEDFTIWENHVWPIVANRIPQFDRLRVVNSWAGQYAYNTIDQNAVIGPHPDVANFLFINGFSGHGLQQAPAMGRGLAEWIVGGKYKTLDLSPFEYARLATGGFKAERAII